MSDFDFKRMPKYEFESLTAVLNAAAVSYVRPRTDSTSETKSAKEIRGKEAAETAKNTACFSFILMFLQVDVRENFGVFCVRQNIGGRSGIMSGSDVAYKAREHFALVFARYRAEYSARV